MSEDRNDGKNIKQLGKVEAEHYNNFYRYDLPKDQLPADKVNSLFDRVMKNDEDALAEVLQIMTSCTFNMVISRMKNTSFYSLDIVDDVIQNFRMEIVKMAHRGFPSKVTREAFFGYLIRIVENQIENYRRDYSNKIFKKEQYDTEELSAFDTVDTVKDNIVSRLPEENILAEESEKVEDEIVNLYIEKLQSYDKEPHMAVTYCYSFLLPHIFKNTKDVELLRKVNEISGREKKPQSSFYDEEKKCLKGEIARKSKYLMGWTMDAMCKKNVRFLSGEFASLYNMDSFNDKSFEWRNPFLANMKKEFTGQCENQKEGQLVEELYITEQFGKSAIKNWSVRVGNELVKKLENKIMADKEFQKRSAGIIEDILER